MPLKGKTAIITGASRGIGAQTAHVFAAAGANVVLLARSEGDISALARDIGDQARAITCDVSRYSEFSAAIEETLQSFGGVDILINNAGVIEPIGPLDQIDPDAWSKVIDVNLKGVFNGVHAVLPHMKSAGGGSILTISSGAAHNAIEGWSHYCASKAAVNMLNRCIHTENAGHGIRAIGLSPGTVATQMQREIKASGINPVSQLEWSDHIPPEWPAKCLAWMCSADADRFCGQEISLRDETIRRKVGLI
ncbi:SDR family oxidoreductase [Nereida sp. MMG025]|uniref:SDR family oxidoreductase n=1 Tax=Nereida sp. MMG025 TaxID=2909981 RepID=UPI001F48237C|nr:SDR family oxidoreductase [Nereida sp. MMG025]MCF6444770.1 SDR family oxidoreductase [Nereida sp. MMG025]